MIWRELILPRGGGRVCLSFGYRLQLFWVEPVLYLQPFVTHICRSHEAGHHDMCVTSFGNTNSEIRLGFFWSVVPVSMQWEQISKAWREFY